MDSGVTNSVTQGMASRLATNPTSENWPNSQSVSGARAKVTTACVRTSTHDARLKEDPPAEAGGATVLANNTPTATKLNQNPGCSKAQGSTTTTATIASSHTAGQGQRRPLSLSATTAANMSTVR